MNTRFTKKSMNLDLATLNALIEYYEKGGKVNVAKPVKRPKNGYTVGKSVKVGDK